MCLTWSTGLFTLLHTYFFGYFSWRCPSQNYPVSVPELSILQIRTKRWEYTAWRDVGAQWNSRGAFTRYRPLWWNDHVMTVYMSSNSMKVISSQFWYLRSIPHHDPAKLHSTICILKYITFIHFRGMLCVVVVWKGSGSSPGHWLSLLSSKYSSIGNGFGDKPSFLSLWFHEQLSFFQFGDKFFVLLYERAVKLSRIQLISVEVAICVDWQRLWWLFVLVWSTLAFGWKRWIAKRTRLMLMYIEL